MNPVSLQNFKLNIIKTVEFKVRYIFPKPTCNSPVEKTYTVTQKSIKIIRKPIFELINSI